MFCGYMDCCVQGRRSCWADDMLRMIQGLLPFTSIALVLALVYAGWTLMSRRQATRSSERAAAMKRAKADQQIVKMYGDGHLKILVFYASPASLKPGERGLVCYGVANAKAVRIEPDVEPVSPSMSRCVAIMAPAKETQYTLTAQDAEGHAQTQSFILQVR
jgi:hypothetical protein